MSADDALLEVTRRGETYVVKPQEFRLVGGRIFMDVELVSHGGIQYVSLNGMTPGAFALDEITKMRTIPPPDLDRTFFSDCGEDTIAFKINSTLSLCVRARAAEGYEVDVLFRHNDRRDIEAAREVRDLLNRWIDRVSP